MKGFKIGPTVNACTKGIILKKLYRTVCIGIWMWNKPIPYNEEIDILLLDTEGLNSIGI